MRTVLVLPLVALVAACTTTGTGTGGGAGGDAGTAVKLPESVVAIAAPNQDLTSVRLLPEDGCYWYRHVGPVETTYLPLRTTEGRPICTRVE